MPRDTIIRLFPSSNLDEIQGVEILPGEMNLYAYFIDACRLDAGQVEKHTQGAICEFVPRFLNGSYVLHSPSTLITFSDRKISSHALGVLLDVSISSSYNNAMLCASSDKKQLYLLDRYGVVATVLSLQDTNDTIASVASFPVLTNSTRNVAIATSAGNILIGHIDNEDKLFHRVATISNHHPGGVLYASNLGLLLSYDGDRELSVWCLNDTAIHKNFQLIDATHINVSPDGKYITAMRNINDFQSNTVYIVELAEDKLIAEMITVQLGVGLSLSDLVMNAKGNVITASNKVFHIDETLQAFLDKPHHAIERKKLVPRGHSVSFYQVAPVPIAVPLSSGRQRIGRRTF